MAEEEAGLPTGEPVREEAGTAVGTSAPEPGSPQYEWQELDAGLKARAMRSVHEEQQKLVVDLGRRIMDIQTEVAVSIARVKAYADLNRAEEQRRIWDTEVVPKREELVDLQRRVKEERELLDAYEAMGKGII